jgi:hypothetical protein
VGLPIAHGHVLESSTASVSILGVSRNSGKPLIKLWNAQNALIFQAIQG